MLASLAKNREKFIDPFKIGEGARAVTPRVGAKHQIFLDRHRWIGFFGLGYLNKAEAHTLMRFHFGDSNTIEEHLALHQWDQS